MNAIEFVKKFGWGGFKIATRLRAFQRYKYTIIYSDEIDFSNEFIEKHKDYMFESKEIKRLVESWELVEKLGGVEKAKTYVPDHYKSERLKQAIELVEQCQ